MIIVRNADDIVVGFEHAADAQRFLDAMRMRLEGFALSPRSASRLEPEKTRLIEFGRHPAGRRAQRGLSKPETFNFLGFTFICGKSFPPSEGQALGRLPAQTEDPAGPHEGETAGGEAGTAAAHASAGPRAGAMAEAGRERLLQLSRRADQRSRSVSLPIPCHAPMATHAAAAQPERLSLVGSDHQAGRLLAPQAPWRQAIAYARAGKRTIRKARTAWRQKQAAGRNAMQREPSGLPGRPTCRRRHLRAAACHLARPDPVAARACRAAGRVARPPLRPAAERRGTRAAASGIRPPLLQIARTQCRAP